MARRKYLKSSWLKHQRRGGHRLRQSYGYHKHGARGWKGFPFSGF